MQYVKLVTSDDETRWINLASVARVTLSRHATTGRQILVIMFRAGGSASDFKIEGENPQNVKAIETLCKALDTVSK